MRKEQRRISCSMPGVTKGWPQYPRMTSRGQLGHQQGRGISAPQGGNSHDKDSTSEVQSSAGVKSRKKRRQWLTASRTMQISHDWEMRLWKNWEPRDDRQRQAWDLGVENQIHCQVLDLQQSKRGSASEMPSSDNWVLVMFAFSSSRPPLCFLRLHCLV